MRHTALFILAFLALSLHLEANHFLGNEISYEHVSGDTYKVKIVLYRDCSEGKLMGQGGGTSNTNRADLTQAFIRTVSTACLNKNIGKITLTKTGYDDITPICNQDNSVCGSQPTFGYGIEAHYYEGLVNFDLYKAYSGCKLQIFINIAERNEDITTMNISDSQNDLYNYIEINPWLENISTPRFINRPRILFPQNQPVYAYDEIAKNADDSVAFKWGVPMVSHNTPISYLSGFSSDNFLSTYCPTPCVTDPNSSIPTGLFLDQQTGEYVFTPTSLNQISNRVLTVEQWRKSGDSMYLASIIRRDVLALVTSENGNNTPKIISNDSYNVCVGQTSELIINATDQLSTYSSAVQDSVTLSVINLIDNLTVTQQSISTAPYSKLELSFTPNSSQIGSHQLVVKARDNNCPKYGESYKIITINVRPKPTVSISLENDFCGYTTLTSITDRPTSFDVNISSKNTTLLSQSNVRIPHYYQNEEPRHLGYTIMYQDTFGCKDTLEQSIYNFGKDKISPAKFGGPTSYCSGQITNNFLTHPTYDISEINWLYSDKNRSSDTLKEEASSAKISYEYTLVKDDLECVLSDSIAIEVLHGPTIVINEQPTACFSKVLDLTSINIEPQGGKWSYNGEPISDQMDISKILPNEDTSLVVRYIARDNICESIKDISYIIKKSPILELKNQVTCNYEQLFRLSNSIKLPYHHSVENISWQSLSHADAIIQTPFPSLNVPKYGSDTFSIAATNTNENKCFASDTVQIIVKEKLKLSINENRTLCQSQEPLDLDHYFSPNAEGGLWLSDHSTMSPDNGLLIADNCGSLNLTYLYDLNQCHDEITIPIKITCKPKFDFDLPPNVCQNYSNILLEPSYTWLYESNEISEFTPSKHEQTSHNLIARQRNDLCFFDTTYTIKIAPSLDFTISDVPEELCEGDDLDFTIQSANLNQLDITTCDQEFSISTNSKTTYQLQPCDVQNGKLTLRVKGTTNDFCPSIAKEITARVHQQPKISIGNLTNACVPYNLSTPLHPISATEPKVTYSIFSNNMEYRGKGLALKADDLEAGLYSILVNSISSEGCLNTQIFTDTLAVWAKPIADFSMSNPSRLTLSKRQLTLNDFTSHSTGLYTTEWYYENHSNWVLFSTDYNPLYELPLDTGIYKIHQIALTDDGCMDTASLSVLLVPDIIAFIPSAFTPDNDGPESNNVFRITSAHAQQFNINIYNRWGQKVFTSNTLEKPWDGTHHGQLCPNGVYLYSIKLINHAGTEYTYQGTVNLIR